MFFKGMKIKKGSQIIGHRHPRKFSIIETIIKAILCVINFLSAGYS